LLRNEVDIAIVRTPFSGAERMRSVEIDHEPVLAVMRDGHPLSRLASIPIALLAQEQFLEATLVRDPIFAAYWYLRDIRTVAPLISRSTTVEEWLAELPSAAGSTSFRRASPTNTANPACPSFRWMACHSPGSCWRGTRRPAARRHTGWPN
jgi:hypothetical protein